jgi:hypothetical protein
MNEMKIGKEIFTRSKRLNVQLVNEDTEFRVNLIYIKKFNKYLIIAYLFIYCVV